MADDNGNPFNTPLGSEVQDHQQAQATTVQASDNGNPFNEPLLSEKAEAQPTPSTPFESRVTGISAAPKPKSTMGKLAEWMDNVTADLQDGGDRTGVGTVMQKLGAHGLHNGNSEAVGDFMGSLPLGLLKAGKGASEVIPSAIGGEKGNTWKGVKDLVGGGLQAMTMPGAFVAPEVSEGASALAGKATAPIAEKASALMSDVPKETESKVVNTIGDIAEKHGFSRSEDADTIVEATKHLATSFQQRAQSVYKQLDEAAPGFQELKDKIQQLNKAYNAQSGIDPDKAEGIAEMLTKTKAKMSSLLSDAQKADWKSADGDWSKFKSLQKFVGKANNSATDLTSDALTDVNKLKSGMQSLGNVSRKGTPTDELIKGFGDEGAAALRKTVQEASEKQATKEAAKSIATKAAVGTGALVGVGTGIHALYDSLSKNK